MMKRLLTCNALMLLLGTMLVSAQTVSAQSGPDICEAARNGEAIPGYEVVYGRGGSGNQVVLGDDGDNDLRGGSGNDILCGFGGDDVLRGNSGNDILVDGETNKGGSGNDAEIQGGSSQGGRSGGGGGVDTSACNDGNWQYLAPAGDATNAFDNETDCVAYITDVGTPADLQVAPTTCPNFASLATAESPTVAFTSEVECIAYIDGGGTPVDLQVAPTTCPNYASLATAETPTVAFTSEAECVAYIDGGNIPVELVVVTCPDWASLATAEAPTVAFTSEANCVAYLFGGGIPVDLQIVPTTCPTFASLATAETPTVAFTSEAECVAYIDGGSTPVDLQVAPTTCPDFVSLATAETPTVAFASEAECIVYIDGGGTTVLVEIVVVTCPDFASLTTSETPTVAFTSEAECVAYITGGGTPVDLQVVAEPRVALTVVGIVGTRCVVQVSVSDFPANGFFYGNVETISQVNELSFSITTDENGTGSVEPGLLVPGEYNAVVVSNGFSYPSGGVDIACEPPSMSLTFNPTSDFGYCRPRLHLSNFEPNTTYTAQYQSRTGPRDTTIATFSPVTITTDDMGNASRNIASFGKDNDIRLSIGANSTGWTYVGC